MNIPETLDDHEGRIKKLEIFKVRHDTKDQEHANIKLQRQTIFNQYVQMGMLLLMALAYFFKR